MAHECIHCESDCHCGGDLDDHHGNGVALCHGCGCEEDFGDFDEDGGDDDEFYESDEESYLCRCPDCGSGSFEEEIQICNVCGYIRDVDDD